MNKKGKKRCTVYPEECLEDNWVSDEERNELLGIEEGETTYYQTLLSRNKKTDN
jgi:hypothetical protein